eukprot:COSAG01_NODE_4403_length_5060_cov_15.005644_2_plen_99_part_00
MMNEPVTIKPERTTSGDVSDSQSVAIDIWVIKTKNTGPSMSGFSKKATDTHPVEQRPQPLRVLRRAQRLPPPSYFMIRTKAVTNIPLHFCEFYLQFLS